MVGGISGTLAGDTSDAPEADGRSDKEAGLRGAPSTNCLFPLHKGSIEKKPLVEFLRALKGHLKQPLLIIWDVACTHHSRIVCDYLDALNGHVQIAF